MMTKGFICVLLILSPIMGEKKIVTTQEFENQDRCEAAKAKLAEVGVQSFCVIK